MSQEGSKEDYNNPINEGSLLFYLSSMGILLFLLISLVSILQQGLKHYIELWLNNTVNGAKGVEKINTLEFKNNLMLLAVIFAIVTLLRGFIYSFGIIRAARKVFTITLNRVMLAPMKLFDKFSIGDIVNRFNMDIGVVDVDLPEMVNYVLQVCLTSVGIFLTLVYKVPLIILSKIIK